MRRPLIATAAASALLLAPHASAAPAADVEKAAAVSVHVPGEGRGLDLVLLASTTSSGATRLRLDLASPGSPGSVRLYGGTLPAGAFHVDGSLATLRTRVGGQPVAVTWQVQQAALSAYTGEEDGRDAQGEGWHAAGKGASVELRIGGLRCSATGLVGTAMTHDDGSYGEALALVPRLQPTRGCR